MWRPISSAFARRPSGAGGRRPAPAGPAGAQVKVKANRETPRAAAPWLASALHLYPLHQLGKQGEGGVEVGGHWERWGLVLKSSPVTSLPVEPLLWGLGLAWGQRFKRATSWFRAFKPVQHVEDLELLERDFQPKERTWVRGPSWV